MKHDLTQVVPTPPVPDTTVTAESVSAVYPAATPTAASAGTEAERHVARLKGDVLRRERYALTALLAPDPSIETIRHAFMLLPTGDREVAATTTGFGLTGVVNMLHGVWPTNQRLRTTLRQCVAYALVRHILRERERAERKEAP